MRANNNIKLARPISLSGNIGDYAQTIGMERIFQKLGVVPQIDTYGFGTAGIARGADEHVLFPSACLITHNQQTFEPVPRPAWALPVFLGIGITDKVALDRLREWFMGANGLPILCRDQVSADMLKKAGFPGEYWGCSSLLLPRRAAEPAHGKIYTCDLDIAPSVLQHIPDSIKKEMLELESQELPVDFVKSLAPEKLSALMYEKMKEKLELLRDTARLVITTRLHIALPCIAMGIPVIKIASQREQRVQLVDSHFQSYRASEFGKIDWDPPVPDIEEAKERMLDIACGVLRAAYERAEENARLAKANDDMRKNCFKKLTKHYFSTFYRGYVGPSPCTRSSETLAKQSFFKRVTGKYPEETHLVFYGAGINGMHLLQGLKNLVDACKSFSFVDSNPDRQGKTYGGYPVKSPESLAEYDKNTLAVFVTPFGCCGGAAESIAEFLETTFDFREGVHFYLYEMLMYSCIQECFGMPCVTSEQYRNDKSIGAWEFE